MVEIVSDHSFFHHLNNTHWIILYAPVQVITGDFASEDIHHKILQHSVMDDEDRILNILGVRLYSTKDAFECR